MMRQLKYFKFYSSCPQIQIGESFTLIKQFTQKDLEGFSLLSTDQNPIHFDEEYASKTQFRKPIIHGMLASSLFSGIMGTRFPGCIYLSQNLQFQAPIYINEEIKAFVRVDEIQSLKNGKKIIQLKTQILKITESDKIAIDGEAKILT